MKLKIPFLLCATFLMFASFAQTDKTYRVKSPESHISLALTVRQSINWSVNHDETEVLGPLPAVIKR